VAITGRKAASVAAIVIKSPTATVVIANSVTAASGRTPAVSRRNRSFSLSSLSRNQSQHRNAQRLRRRPQHLSRSSRHSSDVRFGARVAKGRPKQQLIRRRQRTKIRNK
jgi:hypothetical protein